MNNLLNGIKIEQNALAGHRPDRWIYDLIVKFERKFQTLEIEIKDRLDRIFKKESKNFG